MAVVAHSRPHGASSTAAGSRPRSQSNTAWSRFARDRVAVFGLVVLLLLVLLAVFGPLLALDPNVVDLDAVKQPPSSTHLLGTDSAGRDVWSRLIIGGRVSMSVGVVAVSIATSIGTVVGLLSGTFGGVVDNLLMRFTELIQTFPLFFAVVIFVALVGPNILNVMIVIGLLSWPGLARLVRGQVLALRHQQYVEAAHALGAGSTRVIVLDSQPWLWVPPGMAIALAVLAANYAGEGLRDAFDPRAGGR